MSLYILLGMIFLHIIDDFVLQGKLASMKQLKWWQNLDEFSDKYKYDYIVCLLAHAFEWTCMIILPIMVLDNSDEVLVLLMFAINVTVHAITDDLKATKFKINLVQDQLIHIIQIVVTYLVLCERNI